MRFTGWFAVILIVLIMILLFSCVTTYKTHTTGQKYKIIEVRWFMKRDTIPLDTQMVHPIKINK